MLTCGPALLAHQSGTCDQPDGSEAGWGGVGGGTCRRRLHGRATKRPSSHARRSTSRLQWLLLPSPWLAVAAISPVMPAPPEATSVPAPRGARIKQADRVKGAF